MKIHDLELFLVGPGQGNVPAADRRLLVRVRTSSGLQGWGEACLAWRTSELYERREALLAVLAGRSVYDIEELHTLEALSPAPLRMAVEMAVWDLLGRVLRQPLCNVLGGYYRRRIPISVRVGEKGPAVFSRTADASRRRLPTPFVPQVSRELADQGFHTQTIVTGGFPDEDVKMIAGIRELVGDRIELRLDAQGRFDLETAREASSGLEASDLQFIIDPLHAPAAHSLASLARQTTVPLCVWRAIRSPADVLTAVRYSAANYLVIDLEQVGGIVPARACAAVAAAAGVTPLLGSRASLGIAAAAMLHLAAATAAFSAANEIAVGQPDDSILLAPLDISDGMISVPEGHGLGIEIDRAKLDRLQPA
ncbi:MAG: mandelate racemase/muconate lactonizing enzyme family protein [Thermoguttaceae bacterium]